MSKLFNCPDGLKPYVFHGLDLDYRSNDKEALGNCPFCGREGKFSVNLKTSKWHCVVCGETGNQYKFLRQIWEESTNEPTPLKHLASNRGLESSTLGDWGVRISCIDNSWIVPGYSPGKKGIVQLYRYVPLKAGDKPRLLATPGCSHGVFGVNLYDPKKQVIYLCEGPWDAMKLWETLKTTRETKGRFVKTKSKDNLLAGANVLAVPGCSTFAESWKSVFLKKKVYIVYDNDHPRKHPKTGRMLLPASVAGVERVSGILRKGPKEIKYLRWGREGYDPDLPNNYDIRDFLSTNGGIGHLFEKMVPVPDLWLMREEEKKQQERRLEARDCTSWVRLSNQWRKALRWGEGLDTTLSVMLASIVSTDVVGDQLWVKVIGPASCGKSTLCEAVSVNKNYVLAKSTIRGFHSGFKTDKEGEEDNSLIVQVAGKTLVTKDGDTLLQSPNLGQILSEARDIYDCTSRTHYRNKMSREYTGIRMTWILCGTSSLRSIDSSELGERFLDCVIMEGIDDDLEDEVLLRVARREDRNLSGGRGSEKVSHDQELDLAMQMTGGYVEHLRENALDLLADVETPEKYLRLITRIGKFVAYMRARPSNRQDENAEREFGARLVSQHLRLAKCLTVVLNRKVVNEEVMRRTIKVALDTSRGVTFDLCNYLYEEVERYEGAEIKTLALFTNQTDHRVRELLRFLKAIGVVEQFQRKSHGVRSRRKWRLTEKIEKLFGEVMEWQNGN